MKKISLACLSMLIFCSVGKTQVTNTAAAEPKTNFEVTINGKKYQLAENEELKLENTLTKPTISIKLSDYKKFDAGSITFDYPRHLSYEFAQDTGYKNWTLNGNSFIVMVFELDGTASLDDITSAVVEKFGKEHCVVEDSKEELGHKMCNTKKMKVSLIGQSLTLEYFEIKLNDSKSRFICFQDSMDDNGLNSKEYLEGFKLINSTITFK